MGIIPLNTGDILEKLNQVNLWMLFLIGFVCVVVVWLTILTFKANRQRTENEALREKADYYAAEINRLNNGKRETKETDETGKTS